MRIACRLGFFLPVRVLTALLRRLFLTQLRQAFDDKALHFFNAQAELHVTFRRNQATSFPA